MASVFLPSPPLVCSSSLLSRLVLVLPSGVVSSATLSRCINSLPSQPSVPHCGLEFSLSHHRGAMRLLCALRDQRGPAGRRRSSAHQACHWRSHGRGGGGSRAQERAAVRPHGWPHIRGGTKDSRPAACMCPAPWASSGENERRRRREKVGTHWRDTRRRQPAAGRRPLCSRAACSAWSPRKGARP